ncbi:short transient receptor potential channel 5-like [Amphiura filiformis]|uniref:short transient receptor potential channel 5-like n=1 Tax=Amphiura filiformis TaxID=82378 RepID=UPI003B224FA1
MPPYDASVDTMPHEVDKNINKVDKTSNKIFKPGKNWDRLLKRMERDQKDENDVVKTSNKVLKPTANLTNWERILRKWDRNNKKIDPRLLKKHGNDEKLMYVTLCQAEEHILDNGEEEEEFLSAVEKGDINTFMEMLEKKEQIWLNIECKDSNGMSALRIAITQGYAVIVEQLLLQGVYVGDALIRAVDIGLSETVKKICEFAEKMPTKEERYAIMECHCDNDDFHQDVTPIVLAAQRNDFTIVKILLDYGLRINEPTSAKEGASTSQVDTLLKSVGTLEVYKALSADAYVAQAYLDPVDRSFELSATLQKLSRTDVEFKYTYLKLAENVDEIGRDVISHARNTEEIMTVLTNHDKKKESTTSDIEPEEMERYIGPLPKLSRAIGFSQKHFVAHPNCQQAILAKFYGRLAYLRDRTTMYRRLLFLAVVLCFPFISLTYLYVPTTWVRNNIGCPYTKFMLQMSSDLIFVFLLTCDTFLLDGVHTVFTLLRPTKVLLLLWIIGIAWREVKAYRRRGPDIFTQGKHLRDSGLAFLFIVGVVFDITHYQYVLNNPLKNGTNITQVERDRRSLPDNSFPFSSPTGHFTNLTGYGRTDDEQDMSLEVTRNLSNGAIYVHRIPKIPISRARAGGKTGNAKLAVILGGAEAADFEVTDPDFLAYLAHAWWHPRLMATAFFAVSTVISFLRMLPYVVVSDVIGPLQISLGTMITETAHFFLVVAVVVFSFSVGLTYIYSYYEEIKWAQCLHANDGLEDGCTRGKLPNLWKGIIYLYWSVFGLESMEPLELNNQAWILQASGITLYALFYVLVVVVLMNALIAVMSNVYNEVEENGDMEWKYASTVLWMDVLMDDDVVAPPFNLLPSKEVLEATWQQILKDVDICAPKMLWITMDVNIPGHQK